MGELMEKKVLIVDDEERVVQSIAGVLEDEGFRVVRAKNHAPRYLDARDGWDGGIETAQMDCSGIPSDYGLRSCDDLNRYGRC